jgi:hypothetical protein
VWWWAVGGLETLRDGSCDDLDDAKAAAEEALASFGGGR